MTQRLTPHEYSSYAIPLILQYQHGEMFLLIEDMVVINRCEAEDAPA